MKQTSIKIYTPENSLKHPVKLILQMCQDLLASRELAWRLLVRDISAQYRQSFLGIFWAFVPPVAMAFGLLMARNSKVINVGETDLPYVAYVMLSMTLWQTFTDSLNAPIQGLRNAKPMLSRLNFPREALLLSKAGEVMFNFAIKLLLIFAIFIWFRIPVHWTLIAAPFALITLIAFGFALGILLAPIGGLYMDISKGLTIITGFWLFFTPVIYSPPRNGLFSVIVNFNPVTHLLVTTRELATTGIVSNLPAFVLVVALTWCGLLLSWLFFRLAMPFIIERMSA